MYYINVREPTSLYVHVLCQYQRKNSIGMYVCMYVCMYVRMYVCMYVCQCQRTNSIGIYANIMSMSPNKFHWYGCMYYTNVSEQTPLVCMQLLC